MLNFVRYFLSGSRIRVVSRFYRQNFFFASWNITIAERSKFRPLSIPISLCFLNFFSKEEKPEDKLIKTIKLSILCIERKEYDKAEQMLHLALRMAQDLHSENGITYVYDTMANLALERKQFKKAESLFTEVIRRLLSDGLLENNPKILHISAKIAHMAEQEGDLEKAKIGFEWTLKKIEESYLSNPENINLQELLGLTLNWFGLLLLKMKLYNEAKQRFKAALNLYIEIHGKNNKECITILNNLSVACVNIDEYSEAKMHLEDALKTARTIHDFEQEGVLLANMGLIFLKEGNINLAKSTCSDAWRSSSIVKNDEAVKQAEYCLNEIKAFKKKYF